ncbi:chitobiase/beta-hexosaminidase C-terminal domain-containing protein [Brevibacillus parabrevis]|uniref:chitobiase/beta-hexosaminidase C-terminal domain-containing protein n=1 Tax=Brevibacillus parabrevis TaxID=54914 RepID=UPI00285344B8|nr:chitobiase/beta-hexosaminidase C-terminal domain-containing protein [Brevibacillus parabrevis]MDR4999842.1 chitobiase/beta-hexosaminidase C-terminal domain-containing protein [Brevibacillus parabrevis]
MNTAAPTKQLYGVAYGNGVFVAVGLTGYLYVSDDGVNWTVQTPPTGLGAISYATVIFDEGHFFAGGTNQTIISSPDGSTWSGENTGGSKSVSAVRIGNGKVVASGTSGLVLVGNAPISQAQKPTANPAGGAVAAGTTVTLSTNTAGATIHYTTDGNAPTGSSPVYSTPIPINSAMTIKAIAVKAGITDSAVMSESYTIMPQVEKPTANPTSGAVAAGTTVALSTNTAGATIHYTTDGNAPTGSSPVYSTPIPVNSAMTIKAIAMKAGMTDSTVMSESYTIMLQAEQPTANPTGGAVAAGTTVALSTNTAGATIHYTTDGNAPTGSSPVYSTPIPVNSAMTIKAIAVKAGMTDSLVMSESYTIMPQAEQPTANPTGGAVAAGTTVALSTNTAGATIHYTTDGNAPTGSSPVYSTPIPINSAMTIKAIAVKAGMTDSTVMSESYTIMPQAEQPTANPTGGAVAAGTTVALSTNTAGATIHYTTDGNAPTGSSPVYSTPIPINSAMTIKAIAVKAGMTDSAVTSESYTIMPQAEQPTANPTGGAVAAGTTVALNTNTAGATIHYTTDGNAPTGSSPVYSTPIPVNSAMTIKAIAVLAGMTDSLVMSESYTIMPQVEQPTANPTGGAVAAGTTVALSTNTAGATIHYTTDGNAPTGSSPVYSTPIPINSAMTIKAIAVKAGMTDSTVMSESYTIMPQAEQPTANPTSGAVAAGTTVALSTNTAGATIHYTTDGNAPTGSSPVYSTPIPVNSAMTIKAIAVKAGMTDSLVMSESYTIMPQAEQPTANPTGGAVAAGTTVALSTNTAGATIHYTTDGNAPTGSSPVYSTPIPVNSAMTIKAIAVLAGTTDSTVMSESYTILPPPQVATPTATPSSGAVLVGTPVTLQTTTPGATIYYTTDGNTPTTSSNVYSTPIPINSAVTIKAIAVLGGMTDSTVMSESYTILPLPQVATPTATPSSGAVLVGTPVTLQTTTPGATIYYTTDGNTPTTSSNVYSTPIPINSAVTIKAIAVKAGMTDSAVMSESYTITPLPQPQVATPTATPSSGAVLVGTPVTLQTTTPGATIYYTTDGNTPTTSSNVYSTPIPINSAVTIKAIAVLGGMTDSTVMSESYTILPLPQVATPTATPSSGAILVGTPVTLQTTTPGATIYYTTDGNTPTTSSNVYSTPIPITGAVTIKAIAVLAGMTDSTVMSESYTITPLPQPQVATPTATPSSGAVLVGTPVTLQTTTPGATIYYTTDGNTPTTSSNVYSTPIPITGAVTIKAIAVKAGMTDSTVMSESYTITPLPQPQVATPTAAPGSGMVTPGTPVTLKTTTPGATIYYTTDGSTPTASSDVYSTPIPVNSALTIKAMATKPGMTDSSVMTESYSIYVPSIVVTNVKPAPAITGLPNGTAKTASALGLPSQVEVTLNSGATIEVDADWLVADASYDPDSKEKQTFTVHGNLVHLPGGITNPQNLTASIQVTVLADSAKETDIVRVAELAPITGLSNGTPKTAEALGLPERVEVTLDDDSKLSVSVDWAVSEADYDPESKESQSFTVTGELVKLPKGVTNSKDLTASIQVRVRAENEQVRKIVKVRNPEAIDDVKNGTRKTASALGLPEEVRVTLDDDSTLEVEVRWDVDSADYDPDSEEKQRFTVEGILVNLPDDVENPERLGASVKVTVRAATRDRERDDDKKDKEERRKQPETTPQDQTRTVKVEAGNEGIVFEPLEIVRTTTSKNKKADEVVLHQETAKAILQRAEQNKKDIIRIAIDDLPGSPADEILVTVPTNALELIKQQRVALEIRTKDVVITIPRETLAMLSDKLYFRIVPITNSQDKKEIAQQTIDDEIVQRATGGQQVQVVGKPMTIETNYSNHRTRVTFPLEDVELPKNPDDLQAFLSTLAVFVEHADDEKELKTGTIRYDENGKPVGIEIEISKFSTFTILSLKGKQLYVEHPAYMVGYPNGTFQPNRILTRAEMAAMLASFLQETGQSVPQESGVFADVKAGHWAAASIQKVRDAGLMSGDANGLFHPEAIVTRAQMASIIAKWKNLYTAKKNLPFADVQGHWAVWQVAAVVEQGIMKGYVDGLFHPDQGLTRAEATALFNRVTGRGPLEGMTKMIWKDVPQTHWAFAEIAEATMPHAAYQTADGTEQLADTSEK